MMSVWWLTHLLRGFKWFDTVLYRQIYLVRETTEKGKNIIALYPVETWYFDVFLNGILYFYTTFYSRNKLTQGIILLFIGGIL